MDKRDMQAAMKKSEISPAKKILEDMMKEKLTLEEDLRMIESEIIRKEKEYFTSYSHYGNVIKGWEGLKTKTTKGSANKPPKREEMLFTDSSVTAMDQDDIADIYANQFNYGYGGMGGGYRDLRKSKNASNKKSKRKMGSEYGDSDDQYIK